MAYKIYFDTETTGFDEKKDQVLEYGIIVVDENDNVVEEVNKQIRLKPSVIPSPSALEVTKINPYSKEWASSAIPEAAAFEDLVKVANKYKKNGVKPHLVAYNVQFDKKFLDVALSRSFLGKFDDHFNKSVYDPLITARKLVKEGKIKTPKIKGAGGAYYNSSKQEHVAEALGVKYGGTGAHRAIDDVRVLVEVDKKLKKIAGVSTGDTMAPNLSSYSPGDVVKIVTDSRSSGIKERVVKIIANDPEDEKIVALDMDDIKAHKNQVKDSSVRTFNYGTILQEKEVMPAELSEIESHYSSNKDRVEEFARSSSTKFSKIMRGKDDDWHPLSKDPETIKGVRKRLSETKNITLELDATYKELLAKGIDPKSAKAIMTKAEEYDLSAGGKGWGLMDRLRSSSKVQMSAMPFSKGEMIIGMSPQGKYVVAFKTEDRNLSQVNGVIGSKKDLKEFLKESLGDLEHGMDKFIKDLPAINDFKDSKSPLAIKHEMNEYLDRYNSGKLHPEVASALYGMGSHLKDFYGINSDFSMTKIDINSYDPRWSTGGSKPSVRVQEMMETPAKPEIDKEDLVLDKLSRGDIDLITDCISESDYSEFHETRFMSEMGYYSGALYKMEKDGVLDDMLENDVINEEQYNSLIEKASAHQYDVAREYLESNFSAFADSDGVAYYVEKGQEGDLLETHPEAERTNEDSKPETKVQTPAKQPSITVDPNTDSIVNSRVRQSTVYSSAKCVVCSRSINDPLSVNAMMGPSCRKRVKSIEEDTVNPVDSYAKKFKRPKSVQDFMRGGIYVINIRNGVKNENRLLQFIKEEGDEIIFSDRQEVRAALKAGLSAQVSDFVGEIRLKKNDLVKYSKVGVFKKPESGEDKAS